MTEPVHIASLMVQCRPEALDALAERIAAEPEAVIAARDAAGKLIVLLETESSQRIADLSHAFALLDGALGCSLVFHGIDDETDVESDRGDDAQPATTSPSPTEESRK
ncbi:MAG: chaperone NapD [Marivibrio sp.]|uniref:chaperone NapD n=1 Tax=Marivibrio sp. TaxID=2039719 RepID=UPI0032EBCC9A